MVPGNRIPVPLGNLESNCDVGPEVTDVWKKWRRDAVVVWSQIKTIIAAISPSASSHGDK